MVCPRLPVIWRLGIGKELFELCERERRFGGLIGGGRGSGSWVARQPHPGPPPKREGVEAREPEDEGGGAEGVVAGSAVGLDVGALGLGFGVGGEGAFFGVEGL